MSFAHLHLHSEYSLLDGACRIKDLIPQLKQLGMNQCALTDHGVMYGVVDFYNACKAENIHPVIGCEVYISQDRFDKTTVNREYSHLILLCENQTGYKNLTKLVSLGFTEGFYYKPRIDYKLLEKYSEGLICLSACISGDLPKLLLQGQYEQACEYARYMQKLFGKGNYFIEIMDHNIPEERQVLPQLIALSKETSIPLVATNDCHYINKDDAKAQEVLMCIQTGKTLSDETRLRMETEELYVKSEKEMLEIFPAYPDAIQRTSEIAMRCNVEFDFNSRHLPNYPVKKNETPFNMLEGLCRKGLNKYYPLECDDENSEPRKRLAYELGVISQMGFVDYFLIVWDFIDYAKRNGIMVGPGRGSAAGSIVAYSLGITLLDPIKYSLLFERFLNPERISMPDIDIDFCYERRQEVIDYVTRKYGYDHVAQIITFGTMKAKAAVRDVGRVLGMSYAAVDQVAKAIPFAIDMTLEKAIKESPQLNKMATTDSGVAYLLETSMSLEGMPRHASTHAAGVLITANPVTDYVPLQVNDSVITTQFPMGTLERLGLLKMDFLGLRTLTVIRDALDMMKDIGVTMKVEDIPLDDAKVYEMISQGDTDGVFQLESGGMRSFLQNMKPENFEDIIAAISLYRPGPMDSIPRYIAGKQDPSTINYSTPLLKPILGVTYGCMVYQEQVMQIVRDLAGYSYGRSDLVRRAMSKKKKEVMNQEREYFVNGMKDEDGNVVIDGCVRRGISQSVAQQLFDDMIAFASYAFNKSHAAAYAVIAVQTGWLKAHYPIQFMAATMNSFMDNNGKISGYVQYCRDKKIPILPPDVNKSSWKFSVDTTESGISGIRFGLGAIKNVGHGAVESIINNRKSSVYTSIFDFAQRASLDINKRTVESLIKAGAFDFGQYNRAQLLSVYENILSDTPKINKEQPQGQVSMFDLFDNAIPEAVPQIPQMPEHTHKALLNMEKEMTGIYISGHPLDDVSNLLRSGFTTVLDVQNISENENNGQDFDGQVVAMAGIFAKVKNKLTKKGSMMSIFTLEDLTGQIEGLVFPKIYNKFIDSLVSDNIVIVQGKLSFREDEAPKILADSILPLTKMNVDLALNNLSSIQNNYMNTEKISVLKPSIKWTHNENVPFAKMSQENINMINDYPNSDLQIDFDDTIFDLSPKII